MIGIHCVCGLSSSKLMENNPSAPAADQLHDKRLFCRDNSLIILFVQSRKQTTFSHCALAVRAIFPSLSPTFIAACFIMALCSVWASKPDVGCKVPGSARFSGAPYKRSCEILAADNEDQSTANVIGIWRVIAGCQLALTSIRWGDCACGLGVTPDSLISAFTLS